MNPVMRKKRGQAIGVRGAAIEWENVSAPDASFSWLNDILTVQKLQGVFRAVYNAGTLQAHANISPTTIYYLNTVTGNDSNSGLTRMLAKKTWNSVIAAGNASGGAFRVVIETGSYLYRSVSTTEPTQAAEVIGEGTVYCTSDHRNICTDWLSIGSNTYTTILSGGNFVAQVVDETILDSNGNPTRYAAAVSAAACQSTAGSFYWTSGTLYVHPADNRALSGNPVDDDLWLLDSLTRAIQVDSKSFYFDNLQIRGGFRIRNNSSTGGLKSYFKSCTFQACNLTIVGVSEFVLDGCTHLNASGDSINYDTRNTINTYAVEVDLTSGECGSASDNQASTSHTASRVVRIGSTYYDTAGQAVADVGSGYIWCAGCNMSESNTNVAYYTDNCLVWLDTCTLAGNLTEAGSGTISKRACTVTGTESGNIVNY